ncbi:MAG: Asp-tRNA(Asn)/Glu-tRNA(Gln) amidotransferase subunit GatA [Firmicutes bacterium]|nr:Asp-tRNA(Asn)/Glu-tRNA(Gln) amidotransferase subunit GatA [Bacillota bacterium]
MQLDQMTIHELQSLLQAGEVSSQEITAAVYSQIDHVEEDIEAYITLCREEAMAQAKRADAMVAEGQASPLCGIPLAIKDNLSTMGVRTTSASRILEEYIPPFDATVVARLKSVGAVMVGKTNLDEFGLGSSTENSQFHITRNPWDLSRVPGGSSGGSAAAVAAGEAIAALGSDTGGSIRQPAAFCGVIGFKPTYGLVSRYGLIPAAASLDHVGPITRDVRDAALVLQEIAGWDPQDPTSAKMELPDYAAALTGDITGLVVGLPRELISDALDPEVKEGLFGAANVLESLGARVEEISLPHAEYAMAAFHLVASAEISSSLACFDGVRLGHRAEAAKDTVSMFIQTRKLFGPEPKRRILVGTHILQADNYEAYYRKAQQVRTLIRQDIERAFGQCSVILSPTAPTAAFPLGHKLDKPVLMHQSDLYTVIANLAGIPALSVPCGYTEQGLPMGIQLMGKPFDEPTILKVGHAYEQHACLPVRWPQMEVKTNG